MSQITLKVSGMTCGHCKKHVEEALLEVSGVEKAEVDLEKGEAVVYGGASREELVKAVEEVGYSVQ
jgi:copper chaperone